MPENEMPDGLTDVNVSCGGCGAALFGDPDQVVRGYCSDGCELADAKAKLAALRRELAEADARRTELEGEIVGLRDALARIGKRARKTYRGSDDPAQWGGCLLTIGVMVCGALGCEPQGKSGHKCGCYEEGASSEC